MLDKWIEKSCNSSICCKMMNGSVCFLVYTILATGHPDLLPTAGLLISTGWSWWHCAVQSVQSIIQVKCRKHLAEWLFLCFDCSVYFSLQRCLVPRLTATGTAATLHQPGPATLAAEHRLMRTLLRVELETNLREVFTITEKVPSSG